MKGENPDKFRFSAFLFPYCSAIFPTTDKIAFVRQVIMLSALRVVFLQRK